MPDEPSTPEICDRPQILGTDFLEGVQRQRRG
jgi:hypothetical protein